MSIEKKNRVLDRFSILISQHSSLIKAILKDAKAVMGFGFWVLGFGVWVLGFGAPALSAQGPASTDMTAVLVPDRARVGDTVALKLQFQLPKGAHLLKGSGIGGLDGFRVLDHATKTEENQKRADTLRLMVERLESGDVGPITLPYKTTEGTKKELTAPAVPFTVRSNLGEKPEAARLKPIFGIMPTSSPFDKYRIWILCGIGGLLLVLVVGWWIQKMRAKSEAPSWKAPPHETAMRELKALDEKTLFEQGRIKDFYFDFSEILRCYVEAIRGFPAAEYTIEEISRAITQPQDQAMLMLLRQADMVKFADSLATPAVKRDHMERAFAYIKETSAVSVEAEQGSV